MSLEDTQQPSYHVTAAPPQHFLVIDESHDGLAESVESRTSENMWTLREKKMIAERGNDQVIAQESVGRVLARNICGSTGQGEQDEHDIPHVRLVPENDDDEPSFPTPSDSGPESIQKAPDTSNPPKRFLHQSISHFTPTKLSAGRAAPARTRSTPTVAATSSDRLAKSQKLISPQRSRRPPNRAISPDSFGEPEKKLPPLQRLDRILGGRSYEGESGVLERSDHFVSDEEAFQAEEEEEDVLEVPDSKQLAFRDEGATANKEGLKSPPLQARVITRTDQSSTIPSPPPQPRFQDLADTRSMTSSDRQSRLFSSQAEGFSATQTSTRSFNFAATQVVSTDQPLNSPKPSSTTASPPVRELQTPQRSTRPGVPAHRKLGPTNPGRSLLDTRQRAPLSTPAIPPKRLASKVCAPATTSAHAIKKTQDDSNGSGIRLGRPLSSPVADDPCLQDTYIDAPGPSVPSSATGLPRDYVSSYRSSSSRHQTQPAISSLRLTSLTAGTPHPNAANELEPTFMDERTLQPNPPLPLKIKQYGRKRKFPETRVSRPETADFTHDSSPSPRTSRLIQVRADSVKRPKEKDKGKLRKNRSREASEPDSSPSPENPNDNTYQLPLQEIRAIKVKTLSKPSSKRKRMSITTSKPKMSSKRRSSLSRVSPSMQSKAAVCVTASAKTSVTSLPSLAPSAGLPVFAWWGHDRSYYPGVVAGSRDDKIHVKFLDGDEASMSVDRLRRCELHKGDLVRPKVPIDGRNYKEVELEKDWDGAEAPLKVAFEGKSIGVVPLKKISIRQFIVNATFGDRLIHPGILGIAPRPRATTSPIKGFDKPGALSGSVFLLSSASGTHQKVEDDLSGRITRNGGRVINDWTDLFNLPQDGFGSALRKTQIPFVLALGDKAVMSAKTMAALAKGIPCLAAEYIEEAIRRNADWRGFLIAAGQSDQMAQASSQWVDQVWGGEAWESSNAERMIRPFVGKRVIFVEPKSMAQKYQEVKALVPLCVHALGAASFVKVRTADGIDEDQYDFIIVNDRDKTLGLPSALGSSDKLCNVSWLKQCIIMSTALPPKLYKNK